MTLSPTSAAARAWDAIVIGAGPAGSVAARELAKGGREVLLVDKSIFPRPKVCGCCLSHRAMATLDRLGLGEMPPSLGGARIHQLRLVSARGVHATLGLSGGLAVSRSRLDEALARRAVADGVTLLSGCVASVGHCHGDFREVTLAGRQARARMVIAADGLAGTSLAALPGFEPTIARQSRIGIAAIISNPNTGFPPGTITMVCGQHGYVGAVHVEGGSLNIAAAVNPAWMKSVGGPGPAVERILSQTDMGTKLNGALWRGTPPLTRRRCVEADRLLVVGDAAGYGEPFTGEGMAWALAGSEAAATLILNDPGASWTARHRTLVSRSHRECRWLARILRHPRMTHSVIRVLAIIPSLATPILHRITQGRLTCAASEATV